MLLRHVLLALLVLAPASLAQFTEKNAVAAVKARAKAEVAEFKAAGKAALQLLDAELKAIEARLDETTTVAGFGSSVSDAAIGLLITMHTEWSGALQGVALGTADALTNLAAGGSLEGVYPEALYVGTNGVLDKARNDLLKAATKVRDTAAKRLAKCAALAEKHAGLALTLRLSLPATFAVKIPNQANMLTLIQPARIDLVLGVSALDASSDGMLVVSIVSGTTANVTVGWRRLGSEEDEQIVAVVPNTGHFVATFSNLKEGGYGVWTLQDGSLFEDVADIGFR